MLDLVTPVLALIGALFGSYMGSYMKKKGENLATHEDLDKLVQQMEATTSATKAIEARISNEVWDRQKHWEMKRDALVGALQALEHADKALMDMALAIENSRKNGEQSETDGEETVWKKTQVWQDAMKSYDDKRVIAKLVCDRTSINALYEAGRGMRSNASKLFKNIIKGYDEMGAEVQKLIVDTFAIARKELGTDAE
jgi:hypothetical protein